MSYTIQEARKVMAETDRILKQDERLRKSGRVTARAAAMTKPPLATEVFFTYVGETMDREGCSRAEAIRIVAARQPSLHAAYVLECNKQRRARDAADRRDAARALARRNRR